MCKSHRGAAELIVLPLFYFLLCVHFYEEFDCTDSSPFYVHLFTERSSAPSRLPLMCIFLRTRSLAPVRHCRKGQNGWKPDARRNEAVHAHMKRRGR